MTDKFDVGGSPAAPYFGPGGRQEATEKAREGDNKASATAGPGEAAKEAEVRAGRTQERNRTKRDPASRKAEDFDSKSRNAVENDQGEPVGDPEVPQPGTEPRTESAVEGAKTTSGTRKTRRARSGVRKA